MKVSTAPQGINLHDRTPQTDGKQAQAGMARVNKERLIEGGESESEARVKANVKSREALVRSIEECCHGNGSLRPIIVMFFFPPFVSTIPT